jgi:hypothetical protein
MRPLRLSSQTARTSAISSNRPSIASPIAVQDQRLTCFVTIGKRKLDVLVAKRN